MEPGVSPGLDSEAEADGLARSLAAKKRRSLGRVHLAGLIAATALLLAAGWLMWREIGLERLPGAVAAEGLAQEDLAQILVLKRISLSVHLAKVRRNMLLYYLTPPQDYQACAGLADSRALPEDHPCRRLWESQARALWEMAFAGGGPPLGPEILRDRWGSPYMLDASEFSCGLYGEGCPTDGVGSPGRNGKSGTADDLAVTIPQHVKRDFRP